METGLLIHHLSKIQFFRYILFFRQFLPIDKKQPVIILQWLTLRI